MDGRFLRAVLWGLAAYSSVTQGATLLPTDASAFVTAHNILRCMHNVPPITWSSALAATAQAWAAVCNGQPTDNATRQELNIGENIVGTTVAFPSPQVILDAWYTQESPLVDWASPTLQPATQHVTQIVWKASTQIGCAQCAQGGDSEVLWTVCQYSLAGNVPSGVADNVLPPIHSRQECTVSPASPSPASTVVSALPQRPRAASDSPSPRSRPATPATTTLSASVVALVPSQLSAFVSAHNVLRCMHGAPPFSWSSELAATAQSWATVCNGQPTNASTLQQLNAGENILGSTLDFPSPQAMLDAWYAQESPLVDWASPTLQPATQHLTQILWKASTQIGCAQCSEGGDSDKKWTVCQYSVAGNEPGSVAANVLPPLHSRQECTESPASSSTSPAALPQREHKPSDSPSPEPATPSPLASQSASPSTSGTPSPSPRPSLSPAATPSTSGSKCADEGGVCSCTGLVQFGVGAFWSAPRDTAGQVACSNGVFGDPKPGHVKACYCLPATASASPSPTAVPTAALQTTAFTAASPSPLPSLSAGATGYVKCAEEGGVCGCSGLVQFGVGTAWTTPRAVSGQVACSNSQFGDPKPGKVKACYCLSTTLIANAAVVAVDPAAASQPVDSSSTSSSGFFWPWLALPFALLAIAAVLGALLYCHCHRRAKQRAETFLDPEGLRWDAAAQSRSAPDTGSASPGPAPTLLPEASLFSPTGRASPTVPPPTPGSPMVSQCVV